MADVLAINPDAINVGMIVFVTVVAAGFAMITAIMGVLAWGAIRAVRREQRRLRGQ